MRRRPPGTAAVTVALLLVGSAVVAVTTASAAVLRPGHVTRARWSPSGSPAETSLPRRASSSTSATTPGAPLAAATHFTTLPVGATLPSGEQCAAKVLAEGGTESKGVNTSYNRTKGRALTSGVAPYNRVDGNFTGTTEQILRWTACKWGKDENLVFAQAAVESWWHQDTLGDWTSDASRCPPGHGLGADGYAGLCPQSYGILQSYYPANGQSFPAAITSTAMNADYAGSVWYACYVGIGGMGISGVGKAEDCMAPGNIGSAEHAAYLAKIKSYQAQRIWATANFQQP